MGRWSWLLGAVGAAGAAAAAAADGAAARAAFDQTWPAFVLVAGLLLVGLVAAHDGVFEAAGTRLAGRAATDRSLFGGMVLLVALVTAVLNLDTSVAFLTPIAIHATASDDHRRAELGSVVLLSVPLLSNAASLLLPGSNLTNLILAPRLHLAGAHFAARMALPWVASVVVTAAVVAVIHRKAFGRAPVTQLDPAPPARALGLAAVAACVVLVVVLPGPAVEVTVVGLVAVVWRVADQRIRAAKVLETVDLPTLLGLLGVAVALGAAGRDWSGPARLMSHLDPWATAGLSGLSTVVLNNLPAAALLSARPTAHPLALLIGLNLGPNLFVSGSLAWILWHGAARMAGARPDVRAAVRSGVVSAPLAMAAALVVLMLTGSRV